MQLKLKLKIFNLNDETKFYKITANKRQSRNKACRYMYYLKSKLEMEGTKTGCHAAYISNSDKPASIQSKYIINVMRLKTSFAKKIAQNHYF